MSCGHGRKSFDSVLVCNDCDAIEQLAQEKLAADNERLRGVINQANILANAGDKDFCMWCGRENRQEHTYDCPAFTPEGVVK